MKRYKSLVLAIGCLGLTACASSPPYSHYSQVYYGHQPGAYHSYSYRPYPYSGYEYYERPSRFNYPHFYGNGGYIEQRTWVQPPVHHQPRHLIEERFPNRNRLNHQRRENANSVPNQFAEPVHNPAQANHQQVVSPQAGVPDNPHQHSAVEANREPQLIDQGHQAHREFSQHEAETIPSPEPATPAQANPELQRHHGRNHANQATDSGNDNTDQQHH